MATSQKLFRSSHSPAPRELSSSDSSSQISIDQQKYGGDNWSSVSPTTTTERRGIPGAQFVEDVKTYLSQAGLDLNSALPFLQERLQQYKLVEMKLLARQRDFQAVIVDFEVSEGIYSQACIEDNDSVCLWLRANVMLEYSFEEATSLLKKNLENAKQV